MTSTIKRAEFFIASSSCNPGGQRFHANICLNNFQEAIKFATNLSCYDVFWYGWQMNVYYYRVLNGVVSLEKEIDMNDYVIGAIDQNNKFVPITQVYNKYTGYDYFEAYKKVKYSPVTDITTKYPLPEHIGVSVVLPDMDKPVEFVLNCGYHWEDMAELCDYTKSGRGYYEEDDCFAWDSEPIISEK
jgi:hypothetical protein